LRSIAALFSVRYAELERVQGCMPKSAKPVRM
jgi:hypothetical protein